MVGDVAVFWDLGYLNPIKSPATLVWKIRHLTQQYGRIKHLNAYIGRPLEEGEGEMVETLKSHGAQVHYCPTIGPFKKPTIHHTMEEEIAFHVTLDHPETKTVVFITGDRDFTYCSQILRKNGIRVVVLVKNNAEHLVETSSKAYWPINPPKIQGKEKGNKKKSAGGQKPLSKAQRRKLRKKKSEKGRAKRARRKARKAQQRE